jgi:hypothetical protein
MEISSQLHALAALPQGKAHSNLWIESWVGPRTLLDVVAKRETCAPAGNQTATIRSVV